MIGRRARERQAERDVHRAAERRDLDRRHADVVIRRDHRVELAAHRAHEDGVGGKRAGDAGRARGGREQLVVLAAEAAAVAGVRIERAERDARLGDAEPVAQPVARHARRRSTIASRGEQARHVAQRDVRRREHDAQRIGGSPAPARVAASIIATRQPVRAASISV